MILHQRTNRTIYDKLSLTNSTILTADTILWRTEGSVTSGNVGKQLLFYATNTPEKGRPKLYDLPNIPSQWLSFLLHILDILG
jgi:hypothetical protein